MSAAGRGVRTLILLVLGCALPFSACSRKEDVSAKREKKAELTAELPAKPPAEAAAKAAPALVPAAHSSAPPADLGRSCEQVCAPAASLGCRKAQACKGSCMAMASTGVCQAQLGSFFDCLKSQPSGHWECLEDGTAAIREGYCENQQAAFAACLQEQQI